MSDLPIIFDSVTVASNGVKALDGINLEIMRGGPLVFVGPNGSGKTTLLRVAMGLLAPTFGRVTWQGKLNTPLNRRGFVFQRPIMLRRTVAANLRFAMGTTSISSSNIANRVDELLALVGLSGYEGRPARRLSGGEQQRLALARAIAREPEVLFLDEPTASLDPASAKTVEAIIKETARSGIKIVMATHDLGSARRLAEEIALLHRGRIVEMASAEDFLARPKNTETRAFVAGELLI